MRLTLGLYACILKTNTINRCLSLNDFIHKHNTVYLHTEARQYTAECGGKLVISGMGEVAISVQRTQPTAIVVHSEG